jgi:ammonium transporter, Amt family
MTINRICKTAIVAVPLLLGVAASGFAQEAIAQPEINPAVTEGMSNLRVAIDTIWVLVAAMLVFWMNAGFAMVESGFCQAKNCVNILAKNFIVFSIATLSFWAVGWGLMFGDGNLFCGLQGIFFASGADNSPALGADYAVMNPFSSATYEGVYSAINWTPVPLWAKFFFQLAFAATAATIVSGAVAERIKFSSFLIFSLFLVGLVYPVSGHWIWGGGILAGAPGSGITAFFHSFRDFAGSTVVHSVGGWAALTGALILGPRVQKFRPNGTVRPVMGHNMSNAALGVLILWLGWFGFNPGSTMSAGDGSAIAHVLVNTNIAAVTGTIAAAVTAWLLLKKPDLSMILNGCLAGLVAVTAPCAFVTPASAAVIGLIAGVIVVFGVLMFDRLRIDDPVGALSVHLLNGIWGTLAVGVFYDAAVAESVAGLATGLTRGAQLAQQFKGVVLVGLFTLILSSAVWYLLKALIGIRVSRDEELQGLDVGEHGNEAYPDFQGFLTK